jgi:glycosyltransferase involved in cell wall biosynthesis
MLSGKRIRNRGADLLRNVAGHLSAPRDEALLATAQSAYVLVTGNRLKSRITAYREPRIDRVALRRAQDALERGDSETAMILGDRLYRDHPKSVRVLRLRRSIFSRIGDLESQAAMLHQIHLLDDLPENHLVERSIVGRLNELTPGWLPWIPGRHPVAPIDQSTVLFLNKESTPFRTTGFTMRSRYNFLAAREAGVKPVVVTDLGFPRLLGVTSFEGRGIVDGIPHYRLDLGPSYPQDGPVDQVLEDQAWLTAQVAREVRPAVIHASSGHRGFEHALVGQALRAHIDRPLVYEVRSFFETTWSADDDWAEVGDHYHRRYDTESRAMLAADHVITIAESMRAEIIERGVDPARVTVIPNGVDATAFQPMAADPALQRRYGIDGAFTFGYVSNLDHPRENQELLVDATRELQRRDRRVRCLIIGDGKRRGELERYASRAGVADGVTFTGRVPHAEVPAHYALLDAFVVPRKDERAARMVTPLKPYEALAMARPLVVADLPALLEIAEPEARGLSFPAGDAAALASVLERLMDDPSLGRQMGEAGRDWVARERSWSANGPRFRAVYDQVLEEWAARGADRPIAKAV